MNRKIEVKLQLIRAKKLASRLEGVDYFSIFLLKDDDFLWQRGELKKANSIDDSGNRIHVKYPIDNNEIISKVISLLKFGKKFSCYLIYEGNVGIFIDGNNFLSFLESLFLINNTYDLVLVFESPSSIIVISDNEYDIDIYYSIR